MWTGRRMDMMKLTVGFCHFVNAPIRQDMLDKISQQNAERKVGVLRPN